MPSQARSLERFTSRQKVDSVMRVLRGESVDSVSAELGVSIGRLERWQNKFVAAGTAELSKRKSPVTENWFAAQFGVVLRWTGLLLALAVSIAVLALLLQRSV
jgi:hypothetical protein